MYLRFATALLFVFSSLLFSCGTKDDRTAADSIAATDSAEEYLDSIDKAGTEELISTYRMSKEDSTRIADSIARTKNAIRDFN